MSYCSATELAEIEELHKQAVDAEEQMYIDPISGNYVMTAYAHLQRGKCCGSGCRHCPFNHEKVKSTHRMYKPQLLHRSSNSCPATIKVLFWSSGKDSYLALRQLVREQKKVDGYIRPETICLLTTYNARDGMIAHQNVHIEVVVKQAQHLDVHLLGVPLTSAGESDIGYVKKIDAALKYLHHTLRGSSDRECSIAALVFGDLHLTDIRNWRDASMSSLNIPLEYPLWQVPYTALIEDLERSNVPAVIRACHGPYVAEQLGQDVCNEDDERMRQSMIGNIFDRQLMEHVKALGWDEFGECGEFHTEAQVWLSDGYRGIDDEIIK